MIKKRWVWFILFILLASIFFTTSCTQTQEATRADAEAEAIAAQEADKARMEEEARLKALEEQRIREEQEAERIRQERLKAEAEERIRISKAREAFFSENIYFDFDSAALVPAAEAVLQKKAQWLMNNPDVSVIIEGHCDERGTNEYNLALGDRRARATKTYLVNLGIDADRLSTISYGEERPIDRGHNEIAWAKNRRTHFTVDQ